MTPSASPARRAADGSAQPLEQLAFPILKTLPEIFHREPAGLWIGEQHARHGRWQKIANDAQIRLLHAAAPDVGKPVVAHAQLRERLFHHESPPAILDENNLAGDPAGKRLHSRLGRLHQTCVAQGPQQIAGICLGVRVAIVLALGCGWFHDCIWGADLGLHENLRDSRRRSA